MEDFEKELKLDFLEEATGLLESTEQAFLQLEDDLDNPDLLDEIFRFAHNLKGTSRAVGFGEVAEFTHELENLILKIKQNEIKATGSIVTVLLECNDHIAHMIETLRNDFDATFDHQELISTLKSILDGSFESSDEIVQEEVSASHDEAYVEEPSYEAPSAELFEEEVEATEPLIVEEPIEEVSQELDLEALERMALEQFQQIQNESLNFKQGDQNVIEETNVIPLSKKEETKKDEPKKQERRASAPKEDESLRVSLSKVEQLNDFVGELVILQTVLSQQASLYLKDEFSLKSISQLEKISKEIQDISMSLRMVPVKSTMQKMTRIVRDTSKALNKKVKLILEGEETEIDKTVLEHIADPLVHIVRNAVDHGLESTEARVEAGKSEEGIVIIKSYHEGNNLVIDIIDDGKGIDPQVIRQKAIEKGIIREDQVISDHDMIQYIFDPGFSTKEVVSEVSGRGVGMDVVKTNIERLQGRVVVHTEQGMGSTFKIVLPLTMAIIEAFVIKINEERFIVPLAQVHESLKPLEKDITHITGQGDCLSLRGDVLPILKVSKMLGLPQSEKEVWDHIAIIVKGKNGDFAVAVDDILHQQQVVIKSLGSEIKNHDGFMGSSILGDGKPCFILDLEELVGSSNHTQHHQTRPLKQVV